MFGDIINCRGNSRIALNEHGKVAEEYIERIEERFDNVHIEEFVVMPNHIHGIIMIDQSVGVNNVRAIHELPLQRRKQRRQMLLPKIIGWFKMNSSKSINQMRSTVGRPVWQKNYYEHVVRNEKDLRSIQEYIINNPLQWELDENNPVNIK
jgi:REP element-mobilizing transposase RayT